MPTVAISGSAISIVQGQATVPAKPIEIEWLIVERGPQVVVASSFSPNVIIEGRTSKLACERIQSSIIKEDEI